MNVTHDTDGDYMIALQAPIQATELTYRTYERASTSDTDIKFSAPVRSKERENIWRSLGLRKSMDLENVAAKIQGASDVQHRCGSHSAVGNAVQVCENIYINEVVQKL